VIHRSEGATALLGMSGFEVGAQVEIDGELWLHIQTTEDRAWCPGCAVRAVGHGRRRVRVRDLPAGGRPVVLVWAKRLWRCPEPACGVTTWSEHSDAIGARSSLTERARIEICRRFGQDGDSVAELARAYGIGWHTAMAAVRTHGQPLIDDPARLEGVEALGVDETVWLHAGPRRRTRYVTGFVDLDRGQLLEVVEGRSTATVADWLALRPADWLAQVRVAALDPYRGYATGLRSRLGHATVVLDHFHVVGLANSAIDDVRRRNQQEIHGHRGRNGNPLYDIRRPLLMGHERLTDRRWHQLLAGLETGDRWGEVGAAYLAKELLREVYAATDAAHARRRLTVFYQHCAEAEVPELTRLATTIASWQDEVLAYHSTGMSNGPTEAVNLLIEKARRIGHGYRNFANYRLRLLLTCGTKWQTRPVARIRGRQPRFAA